VTLPSPSDDTPAPEDPTAGFDGVIGTVGSPSTTSQVTVDVAAQATSTTLLGDLVALTHRLDDERYLLALGTVAEIETRNRWHEDPNMRGVVKLYGYLPHLSASGDTRTATVVVQAVYQTDAPEPPFRSMPEESSGALGMSPTTGVPVRRVDDKTVQALVTRHAHEIVYMGYVYRTRVGLPLYVRDFAGEHTDGAFHMGVFGRNGSGKTALAVYLLAAQMRHKSLGVLVFDTQGQWRSQAGFPLDLQSWATSMGRPVQVVSIAEDLRLPTWATTFTELLEDTQFFRHLTIRHADNRQIAIAEMTRLLRDTQDWADQDPDVLLRNLLASLAGDEQALTRIFNTKTPRERLRDALTRLLSNPRDFEELAALFRQVHNVFAPTNPAQGPRRPLADLLAEVVGSSGRGPAPYVVVDLSASSGLAWLDDSQTKARLIRVMTRTLLDQSERRWRQTGKPINTSVVFEEAHRFASARPEGEQAALLSARLVDYVRTTRKYGLGWMFITQEISALSPAIYHQLRIRAFGYGLTTGSDLTRLTDEVGRGPALELYKSFPDPRAMTDKTYPFMLTGPVSPLSFTSAPVFLEVHTDIADFHTANQHLFARLPVPRLPEP
jgi:hypothetical protein